MSDDQTPKANPQLSADRFKLSESVNASYTITVEAGITRAQILHPDFWGGVAMKLRPYDEIKVRCDDGTIFAELLVLEAARTFARVRALAWHDLTTRDVAKTQDELVESAAEVASDIKAYEVKYRGPHLMWCVIRKSDSAAILEKATAKDVAETWLSQYLARAVPA